MVNRARRTSRLFATRWRAAYTAGKAIAQLERMGLSRRVAVRLVRLEIARRRKARL